MHGYVHWCCSINYCVKYNKRLSGKITLMSPWNDFSSIPLGKCVSEGRAIKGWKKFKFEIFDSTLYMKSGNMPLIQHCSMQQWNTHDNSCISCELSFYIYKKNESYENLGNKLFQFIPYRKRKMLKSLNIPLHHENFMQLG